MDFAKIINDEEGQLLRLPKGYHFDCDEVVIKRIGSRLISVYTKDSAKEIFRESLEEGFSDDCIEAIEGSKERDIVNEHDTTQQITPEENAFWDDVLAAIEEESERQSRIAYESLNTLTEVEKIHIEIDDYKETKQKKAI